MTKIALTAAAILVATGAAFAGSDNYDSNNVNQPAVSQSTSNVDTTAYRFDREVRKGTGRRQCQRAGSVGPGHLGSLIPSNPGRRQRAVGLARRSCFLCTRLRRSKVEPIGSINVDAP